MSDELLTDLIDSKTTIEEVKQKLIKYPSDLERRAGVKCCTPLHRAIFHRNMPVIRYLIEIDAIINVIDNNEEDLIQCSMYYHATILKILIEHGADIGINFNTIQKKWNRFHRDSDLWMKLYMWYLNRRWTDFFDVL